VEPISATVVVERSPESAFELFTTGMGTWWDPAHTPDPGSLTGMAVESDVGGTVALERGDASYRSTFGDWPRPLGRFAAAAEG
jgi:hypothetical protein